MSCLFRENIIEYQSDVLVKKTIIIIIIIIIITIFVIVILIIVIVIIIIIISLIHIFPLADLIPIFTHKANHNK